MTHREKGQKVIITGVVVQKPELFRDGCFEFAESHDHRDEQPEMPLVKLPRTPDLCALLLFLLSWSPHRDWGTEPETGCRILPKRFPALHKMPVLIASLSHSHSS